MINLNDYCEVNFLRNKNFFETPKVAQISYPETGNELCSQFEDESFWFKHRNNCILNFMRKNNISGPLFDIGGGNGIVSSFLQINGYETVLIEPGQVGCENASRRGLPNIIQRTFEDCLFKKNIIPAIGLFDVLEHIEDDGSFLNEAYDKLLPGGFIILTVPAHQWLYSQDDVEACHFRRYSSEQIKNALWEAKFEIIEARSFFSHLILPIFIMRTLPTWLGHKRKISNKKTHRIESPIVKFISSILCQLDLWQTNNVNIGASLLVIGKKKS